MARQKTPIEKARATGAILRNPARYKNETQNPGKNPIGAPPNWLTEAQRDAWLELASDLPWLQRAHVGIVGIAATLLAKLRSNTASMSEMNLLRLCLGQLGATPVDAHRVAHPQEMDEDDPAEAYFT